MGDLQYLDVRAGILAVRVDFAVSNRVRIQKVGRKMTSRQGILERGWETLFAAGLAISVAIGANSALADFNYPDFSSVAGLTLNGNASQVGNVLQLTPDAEGQSGSAWRTTSKAHLADGFDTTFTFRMATNGADGMAFVIQDDSATVQGSGGSGLGFEGIPRSIAIEIDSFGFFPETDNHISVQTRGNTENSAKDIQSLH